jgi:hypothetical protein
LLPPGVLIVARHTPLECRRLAQSRLCQSRLDPLNKCPLKNKWTLPFETRLSTKRESSDAYGNTVDHLSTDGALWLRTLLSLAPADSWNQNQRDETGQARNCVKDAHASPLGSLYPNRGHYTKRVKLPKSVFQKGIANGFLRAIGFRNKPRRTMADRNLLQLLRSKRRSCPCSVDRRAKPYPPVKLQRKRPQELDHLWVERPDSQTSSSLRLSWLEPSYFCPPVPRVPPGMQSIRRDVVGLL